MNESTLGKSWFCFALTSAFLTSAALAQEGPEAANELTLLEAPQLESLDPTMTDQAPTMAFVPDPDEVPAPADGVQPALVTCARESEEAPSRAEEDVAARGDECVELIDGAPMIAGPDGHPLPIVSSSSAAQIELRLGERRAKLDQTAEDLELQAALLEAAEKRLEERGMALQALVDSMNTKLDAEDAADFTALVSMYEAMKPDDAATIFDDLSRDVLIPLVRAMSPRRAAAILARMQPALASDVTARLAQDIPNLN